MGLLFVGMYVEKNAPCSFTNLNKSTGPDAPDHISDMAMDGDSVWIASGTNAIQYIRGKEVSGLLLYFAHFSYFAGA